MPSQPQGVRMPQNRQVEKLARFPEAIRVQTKGAMSGSSESTNFVQLVVVQYSSIVSESVSRSTCAKVGILAKLTAQWPLYMYAYVPATTAPRVLSFGTWYKPRRPQVTSVVLTTAEREYEPITWRSVLGHLSGSAVIVLILHHRPYRISDQNRPFCKLFESRGCLPLYMLDQRPSVQLRRHGDPNSQL